MEKWITFTCSRRFALANTFFKTESSIIIFVLCWFRERWNCDVWLYGTIRSFMAVNSSQYGLRFVWSLNTSQLLTDSLCSFSYFLNEISAHKHNLRVHYWGAQRKYLISGLFLWFVGTREPLSICGREPSNLPLSYCKLWSKLPFDLSYVSINCQQKSKVAQNNYKIWSNI